MLVVGVIESNGGSNPPGLCDPASSLRRPGLSVTPSMERDIAQDVALPRAIVSLGTGPDDGVLEQPDGRRRTDGGSVSAGHRTMFSGRCSRRNGRRIARRHEWRRRRFLRRHRDWSADHEAECDGCGGDHPALPSAPIQPSHHYLLGSSSWFGAAPPGRMFPVSLRHARYRKLRGRRRRNSHRQLGKGWGRPTATRTCAALTVHDR